MPTKDVYHDHVKEILISDGWTITNDPLHLKWGTKDLYVDLGAEKLVAAEKAGRKIAVEIKSFIGKSEMHEFEIAIGQYIVYNNVLINIEPERTLYLAIHNYIYSNLFEEPIGSLLIKNQKIKLIVFDPNKKEIIKWID